MHLYRKGGRRALRCYDHFHHYRVHLYDATDCQGRAGHRRARRSRWNRYLPDPGARRPVATINLLLFLFCGSIFCPPEVGYYVAQSRLLIAQSVQVVLIPVIVGVFANMTVPKVCRKVEPFCPLVGVLMTVVLVGASVAQCSQARYPTFSCPNGTYLKSLLTVHSLFCLMVFQEILAAGIGLQFPLMALHLFGGVAGYWLPRLAGQACSLLDFTMLCWSGLYLLLHSRRTGTFAASRYC